MFFQKHDFQIICILFVNLVTYMLKKANEVEQYSESSSSVISSSSSPSSPYQKTRQAQSYDKSSFSLSLDSQYSLKTQNKCHSSYRERSHNKLNLNTSQITYKLTNTSRLSSKNSPFTHVNYPTKTPLQEQIQNKTSPKNLQQSVKQYLNTNVSNYKSQLNYLCQHMKIQYPVYKALNSDMEGYSSWRKQFKDIMRKNDYKMEENKRLVIEFQGILKFKCKYLNNTNVEFVAKSGRCYGHRSATNKVAYNILMTLYTQIPQMWLDFLECKQRKAIIC